MVKLNRVEFKKDVLENLSNKELSEKYNLTQKAVKEAIKQLRDSGDIPKKIVKRSIFSFEENDTNNTNEQIVDVRSREIADPFAN